MCLICCGCFPPSCKPHLFTDHVIFQLLLSSFPCVSAFLLLVVVPGCQAKSMSICLQSLFTASTPLPPLMNQRFAHPECREPINRCEKLGFVGNRIRTTDIFCQFQVWRHSAFGRPAPQEGHSSLLSYASSPKKESGVLKRKRPLSLKSRSISKSLAIFPTLCATSR